MDLLEYLQNLLTTQTEQRTNLMNSLISAETVEERTSINEALTNLDTQINGLNEQIRNLQANQSEQRQQQNQQEFNPLASYGLRGMNPQQNEETDPYDTVEYRTAFMNFACRNVPISQMQTRENQITMTSDTGAVIPTSILNEIIQKLEKRGGIYAKIRKLNIQGGVEVPILSLKPTAQWITEGKGAESQKLSANEKVSFNYYGLEVKLSQTLLANVTTLQQFQALFVPLSVEAIVRAIEIGTFTGTGSGQMLGILKDSRVENVITLAEDEFTSWQAWKQKVFAKIPLAYSNGDFYMANGTFEGYIDGMTDKNGQPIGRVNYGIANGSQYRFGGKVVEPVEDDVIKPFDSALENDVVAVFVNLNDYAINTNLQMKVDKWEDRDTHELKNNCLMILDGKLIDVNGVILIKKGPATLQVTAKATKTVKQTEETK